MDIGTVPSTSVLNALRGIIPQLQGAAQETDRKSQFPENEMALLRQIGILVAPLPVQFGGFGFGVEPGRGNDLLALLHLLGQGSLPLGRLMEAHVNAIRIVMRYGNVDLQHAVSEIVTGGGLLALWVTDPPRGGLSFTLEGSDLRLTGGKRFCSGAGHATHAVVTAADGSAGPPRLLLVTLNRGEQVSPLPAALSGMRGAVTGQVDFSGVTTGADRLIGEAGDYMREPDFSGGAWRSSAVALGGLYCILEQLRLQLAARGRGEDPHQRARFGQAVIGHETGRLWLREAGSAAEDLTEDPDRIIALVGLARTAVERACLDGIEVAQRSLGLGAFLTDNPVERMTRDLQTYLRQPAGDEVLHHAAGHFMLKGLPTV